MKTCKRCFRKFDESEIDVVDVNPATQLADIFLWDIGVEDINDLCPKCREELRGCPKMPFSPNSALYSKNYPRNIN
jgi:hypothetical protein